MFDIKEARIAVVGLGYVGLPLAIEFGTHYPTIGLDTKTERIRELAAGEDSTREVDCTEIAKVKHLLITGLPEQVAG
jgi:UDP-N-acetyl-D-galactosamine dehydrogenase